MSILGNIKIINHKYVVLCSKINLEHRKLSRLTILVCKIVTISSKHGRQKNYGFCECTNFFMKKDGLWNVLQDPACFT